jgi:Flp pilus assembly protein TadG
MRVVRAARTGGDRGGAAVELAIIWPALLVLIFGAVQAATYFTARTVALTAAQTAVTVERAYDAETGDGRAAAEVFLDGAGDWLSGVQVSEPRYTADGVSYTVTGNALSLVPGTSWRISQTAHGTLERFVP